MAGKGAERDPGRAVISWAAVLLGVVLVVAVCVPRFAVYRDMDVDKISLTSQPDGWFMAHDDGVEIGRFSFDNYSYIASVAYFRGEFDRYPIYGPWRWRVLPSWIASRTPIDNPAVAYSVVSLAFLVAGVIALVATSARNGLRARGQAIVAVLFALAFPMVWYGTSGYVDGPLVAMLCIGLFLIQSRRWWLFLLLLPVGFLVKETYLLIVPVAATYLWARAKDRRDWLPFTAASVVIVAVTWVAVRWALPTPRTLDWIPRWRRLTWNLSRPEAVGSFLLTCGLVVPLGLWSSWRLYSARKDGVQGHLQWREQLHLVVGLITGLAVAAHGFLTAYADGRHGWTTYPFAAILSALLVEQWLERRTAVPAPTGNPAPVADIGRGGSTA